MSKTSSKLVLNDETDILKETKNIQNKTSTREESLTKKKRFIRVRSRKKIYIEKRTHTGVVSKGPGHKQALNSY